MGLGVHGGSKVQGPTEVTTQNRISLRSSAVVAMRGLLGDSYDLGDSCSRAASLLFRQ